MNLLDGYIASSCILSPKSIRQKQVITVSFGHMSQSIAKVITKRKKELPNENCVFILTCKIYKLDEYKKAYPKVFKKEEK